MKYTIETTQTGCIETLEIGGKIYKKEWQRTSSGCRCNNNEFYEQMESDGIDNKDVLNKAYDIFDDGFKVFGFIELSEME